LRQEETRLGRLFITGQIGEDAYRQLRVEWFEKVCHSEQQLTDLERETGGFVDDLDVALWLLARASGLYDRLESKRLAMLMQTLASRIMVSVLLTN
jgi:hypothetical protein